MTRLRPILKSVIRGAVDHLWPPVCAGCDVPVQGMGGLCPDCWDAVTFLSAPQCYACGVPFPFDAGEKALCAECMRARPPYERARAAFVYDDASRGMILAFKHADRTDLVPALVNWMKRPAAVLLADADFVCPVPLHWSRLLSRRYNQSALLSNALASGGQVRSVPDLLIRKRRTGTQGGKSRAARRRNVQGVFRVRPRYVSMLRDKRVLLVDDVMTTGATVEACARALLRVGAQGVDVITIARAVTSGL
ncbi:MAG: ComF family protein [Rhodospirillales bacterium]|nr:ComF family protein [Rhodospirillales bacterium]